MSAFHSLLLLLSPSSQKKCEQNQIQNPRILVSSWLRLFLKFERLIKASYEPFRASQDDSRILHHTNAVYCQLVCTTPRQKTANDNSGARVWGKMRTKLIIWKYSCLWSTCTLRPEPARGDYFKNECNNDFCVLRSILHIPWKGIQCPALLPCCCPCRASGVSLCCHSFRAVASVPVSGFALRRGCAGKPIALLCVRSCFGHFCWPQHKLAPVCLCWPGRVWL